MFKQPIRICEIRYALVIRILTLVISFLREQRPERALVTTRLACPAKMFSHHHQLRVIILPVIQPRCTGFLVQRRLAQ